MADNKEQYSLEQIEAMLDAFSVDSDDFVGQLPVDFANFNFCEPASNDQWQMNTDVPHTMEDIEALCQSDFIQGLLDTDRLEKVITGMMNNKDIINKGTGPDKSVADTLFNGDNGTATLDNYAVIEFGVDYTNGDKVDYSLNVKPGDRLTEHTIIGQIVQNGLSLPLRSIFKSGYVLPVDEENSGFYHLFPNHASRHIIIKDYQLSDGIGFNHTEITSVGTELDDNTNLYNLIKDHLCQATLPLILRRHETKDEHAPHILVCPYETAPSSASEYNTLLDNYFAIIDSYGKKFKDICSSKNIKAANGTHAGTNKLAEQAMDVREQMLNDIINEYMRAYKQQTHKMKYDGYDDCKQLGKISGNNLKYNTIKNGKYNNYYTYLISSLDIENTENKYVQEYYALLQGIISKRMDYEGEETTKQSLIDEYDQLYKKYIYSKPNSGYIETQQSTKFSTDFNDVYSYMQKAANQTLQTITGELAELYIKIINLSHKEYPNNGIIDLYTVKRNELISEFNETYSVFVDDSTNNGFNDTDKAVNKLLSNNITTDNVKGIIMDAANEYMNSDMSYKTLLAYKRLARLYLYISSIADEEPVKQGKEKEKLQFTDDYTPLTLVTEEAQKIMDFWDKVISAYTKKSIKDIINGIHTTVKNLTKYAVWPQPGEFVINSRTYAHYLFKNPVQTDNDTTDDEDSGVADYMETDSIPQTSGVDGSISKDDDGNGTGNNVSGNGSSDGSGTGSGNNGANDNIDVDSDAAAAALDGHGAVLSSDNDPGPGEITVTDTAYWQKYFALATVISLPFLADGFDVPPMMTPIPMPGIYIAFKAIHIKLFHVVMVIGLAIRGIYISPILLTVNLSDKDLSALLPLITILDQIKNMFDAGIAQIESTIPNLVNIVAQKLEKENKQYMDQNKMYQAQLSTLQNAVVENDALIKKQMQQLVHPNADHRQNILRTEDIAANNQ